MKQSKQYFQDDNGIHLVVDGNDLSLCGDAEDNAWGWVKRGPVTCEKCVAIIRECRGVRVRDVEATP